MSHYHSAGEFPHKRHTQFRGPDGNLRWEELFSTRGFGGPYSLLYHATYPGEIVKMEAGPALPKIRWQQDIQRNHRMRTLEIPSSGDYLESRRLMAFNDDVLVSVASPDRDTQDFYRNGLYDELIVIVAGVGEMRTPFGRLRYEKGDMIVVPRGTTQSFHPGQGTRLLVLETRTALAPPTRYYAGSQLAEHSPFCERDFRLPELLPPVIQDGDFKVVAKFDEKTSIYHLPRHPFDVTGWDGSLYPHIINIRDFEPLTRRIHTMPDEMQALGADGVMIALAVPRMLEYHPDALPMPPIHSNIDCDELFFSLDPAAFGDPTRSQATLTHYPRGLLHGVKPDLVEKSIGLKHFDGHALMVDTFKPLHLSELARQCDEPNYHDTWRTPGKVTGPT